MDINQQLQPIVTSLLDSLKGSIEAELRNKISDEVVKAIANTEVNIIVERIITQRLNERVAEFNIETKTRQQLEQTLTQITNQLSTGLAKSANEQITAEVTRRVAVMDIGPIIQGIVENKINNLVQTGAFGKESIDHSSINFKGFKFSGDVVKGGIIENFGSTGIDDRSTQVQMTLMDQAVAFEKAIWTPSAIIKGKLTVEGDLVVLGDIDSNSPAANTLADMAVEKIKADTELLELHSDAMLASIGQKGIDLKRITQDGREIVNGNQLGYQITDSNLQRVGMLRDLQTQGEAILSDTLYVTGKRVGINTIEPSAVFVVWDEEIEMVITKHSSDTGYIGMPRFQRLVLGANNKDNLILDTDGSVEIENLRVGNTPMSSATAIPDYNAITGTIVWNENPAQGGPVGWICLGATRWAKFGIIE
jgi:hypothetical protein